MVSIFRSTQQWSPANYAKIIYDWMEIKYSISRPLNESSIIFFTARSTDI